MREIQGRNRRKTERARERERDRDRDRDIAKQSDRDREQRRVRERGKRAERRKRTACDGYKREMGGRKGDIVDEGREAGRSGDRKLLYIPLPK